MAEYDSLCAVNAADRGDEEMTGMEVKLPSTVIYRKVIVHLFTGMSFELDDVVASGVIEGGTCLLVAENNGRFMRFSTSGVAAVEHYPVPKDPTPFTIHEGGRA